MSPAEALNLLRTVCRRVQLVADDHEKIQQALEVLGALIASAQKNTEETS